jgi:hypothetical protein
MYGLQEDGGDYSMFTSRTVILSATPTAYAFSISVTAACKIKAIFGCSSKVGVFHVSNVAIAVPPASTLTMPHITAAYDSSVAKTTINLAATPSAEYIYLYEGTSSDPSAATRVCRYEPAQSSWITYGTRESAPCFWVSGYGASGTYYYWVSAQKACELESEKSQVAAISVTGAFNNYASIPSGSACRSLGDNWHYSVSATGVDSSQYFYATAGMKVTIGCDTTPTATVGIKLYYADASPSYLLGTATSYSTDWQTATQTITVPSTGYYVIERYSQTTGSYSLQLGLSSS